MKRHFVLALTAGAVGAVAPAARASASSSISVTGFCVEVSASQAGRTPALSFAGAGGSTAESGSYSGGPSSDQSWAFASGSPFGDAASATTADPFAGGSAVMVGDVFGPGAVARTSAYASSLVAQSYGEGTLGLVNDVAAANFTLAPGTLMTISATVQATASSSGAGPDEFAESGLLMAIGDATGLGPQRAYVDFGAYAFGGLGAYSDTESAVLRLTYENDTDADIVGLFSGYIASYASSGDPVSAVPEPGGASMMLAGLFAAAALARRRNEKGRREPAFAVREQRSEDAARAAELSLPTCR